MSGTWVHHSPDLMKRKERRWKKHVEIFWAVWACQIGESCWDRVPHQILRGSPQNIQHWMDMTIVDGHVLGQFAKAFWAMRRNFWWHRDQSSLSSSGAQVTRLAWWYIDMPCNLMSVLRAQTRVQAQNKIKQAHTHQQEFELPFCWVAEGWNGTSRLRIGQRWTGLRPRVCASATRLRQTSDAISDTFWYKLSGVLMIS